MPEALAMVKVGNSECGFLKLTPLSRTSAIAGAVSGVTFNARSPSGMNRMILCGVPFCADATPANSNVRPVDRDTSERRIGFSPKIGLAAMALVWFCCTTDLLHPSAVGCAAVIRFPKACGLGVFLRAEPAVRLGESRVTAAGLQVIDADIAGKAGPRGKFTLDAATRRHGGFIGEEHRADLAIFVAPAGFAQ